MTFDFADGIKPTLFSWVLTGLMALTFIVFAKWITTRYHVVGLSELVSMA